MLHDFSLVFLFMQMLARSKGNCLQIKILIFRNIESKVLPNILEILLTFRFSLETSLFSKCVTGLFKC